MTSVVTPALSIRMKAFGANLPRVSSGACSGSLTACAGRWKANAKPPASAPFMKVRREVNSVCCWRSPIKVLSFQMGRCALDRLANSHIGSASADVPRHGGVDIRVIGCGCVRQQRRGRHDLPGLTVAALHDFKL